MKYFQARLPLLNGQLEFESVNEAENNKNVLPHSGTTALFAPHNRYLLQPESRGKIYCYKYQPYCHS